MSVYLSRVQRIVLILLLVSLLVAGVASVGAQASDSCVSTIREAVTQAAIQCSGMGVNTVCYGFPEIESVLSSSLDEDAFSEPGDLVSTSDVITLRTGPVDTIDETWGIAVAHTQTSLPSGFEDNVIIVELGGAEIEAGVTAEDAFVPLDTPISLSTSATGELRKATLTVPSLSEVVGSIPSGSTVLADALSEDGEWVRVVYDNQPGWLSLDALGSVDLAELPVLEDSQLTAMQSFYLRTGIDAGSCMPTSSWVFVQGPQAVPVDIIVNNVTIRIESTIALRTLRPGEPVGEQLQLLVLYGLARVNPDSPDEIVVPPGYTLLINHGPDFISAGIEGDEDERGGPIRFGTPQIVSQVELNDVDIINQLLDDLWNYPVQTPIIITPSGVGMPIAELVFEDPGAIFAIANLCNQGELPAVSCQVFRLDTP